MVGQLIIDAKNVYETTEIIEKIKSFIPNFSAERPATLPNGEEEPVVASSWFSRSEDTENKNMLK